MQGLGAGGRGALLEELLTAASLAPLHLCTAVMAAVVKCCRAQGGSSGSPPSYTPHLLLLAGRRPGVTGEHWAGAAGELGEQGQEGGLLLEVLGLVPGLEVPWSRVRELALGCRREDRLALPLCLVRILGQEEGEEELVLASRAYWAGRGCLPAFSTPLPAQIRGLLDWKEAGFQGVQVTIFIFLWLYLIL